MKSRIKWSLAFVLAVTITLAVRAQEIRQSQIHSINVEPINVQPITINGGQDPIVAKAGSNAGPVNLVAAIPVPAPIASTDLIWADEPSGRVFLADRTNKSVDVFDGVNEVFVTSIPGFLGTPGVNGQGPNGVLVTPDNFLWAGDGNSTLRVVDLNISPFRITQSISVGGPNDGRADELGYDPIERVILVGNDASSCAAERIPRPLRATCVDRLTTRAYDGADRLAQPRSNDRPSHARPACKRRAAPQAAILAMLATIAAGAPVA